VAANKCQKSVKTKRKSAGWSPGYRLELQQLKSALILDIPPMWHDGLGEKFYKYRKCHNARPCARAQAELV
jgi:hypothetical protein